MITEAAAIAMARGAREVLGSDVGIAATGVAGPEESEGHPAGTVCVAVVIGDPDDGGVEVATTLRLPGRRNQVREFTVISLLGLLRRELLARDAADDGAGGAGDGGDTEATLDWSTASKSVWGRAGTGAGDA